MAAKLNLTIGPDVRRCLEATVRNERTFDAVPSLIWATDTVSRASGWMVGFYDRKKIGDEFLVDANGFELVVEPQWRSALDGAELKLFKDHYVVEGGRTP